MARERLFFTGSVNIIGDQRPSGLDLRVYACVSMHDGMSLPKGTGRGCYATFATLIAEIGCDAANLSRSLKRLVEWGYITEERQDDRRRKTYRVVFESRETWRNRQQSKSEIVGNGECGNGGNPLLNGQHYSSLKELDYPEGLELDSSKEACSAEKKETSSEPVTHGRLFNGGSNRKIPLSENDGAQLAMFERAWKVDRYTDEQVVEWHAWLQPFYDDPDINDANNQRAVRLFEAVDCWLWERKLGPHAGEAVA